MTESPPNRIEDGVVVGTQTPGGTMHTSTDQQRRDGRHAAAAGCRCMHHAQMTKMAQHRNNGCTLFRACLICCLLSGALQAFLVDPSGADQAYQAILDRAAARPIRCQMVQHKFARTECVQTSTRKMIAQRKLRGLCLLQPGCGSQVLRPDQALSAHVSQPLAMFVVSESLAHHRARTPS